MPLRFPGVGLVSGKEFETYGVRRSHYEGPGSFTSFLMTQASASEMEMVSLVAEIPTYLQGTNPASIEAVTRRLAKILKLPLDLDSLRSTSTEWELRISSAVEENEELAEKIRELEKAYDDELLELATPELPTPLEELLDSIGLPDEDGDEDGDEGDNLDVDRHRLVPTTTMRV